MARRGRELGSGAEILIPELITIDGLKQAAPGCQACDLWRRGTQTVFGEAIAGRLASSPMMLVGEQPGDEEDRVGRPFVGPAGRLLDSALERAGIDRMQAYVTNVVKHFKWEPRGKRRIHAKPNSVEIAACRPWLEAELAAVRPQVLVCLGSTAAQALLGRSFRVTVSRGERVESPLAPFVTATIHPSAILRAPDSHTRRLETERFISDLKVAAAAMENARRLTKGRARRGV